MWHCKMCDKTKPRDEFAKDTRTGRLYSPCKSCRNEKKRARRQRLGDHDMHRDKCKKYGLTMAQYDEMLEAQNGVCAVCGAACRTGSRLAIDHDHETGKVRGLLCRPCNSSLGLMQDDAARLRAAADYLESHATRS